VYAAAEHPAGQGNFLVIDSLLSEEAVLGFEYGYATAQPYELVIWEAQFGDFANGAQVVIDQFIASGEGEVGSHVRPHDVPAHGYEGQGPEHSIGAPRALPAALRRAQHQVCVPTTAGQFFHMIRRRSSAR
jgi:2-oxoglutarate dehydrogenase E1 component